MFDSRGRWATRVSHESGDCWDEQGTPTRFPADWRRFGVRAGHRQSGGCRSPAAGVQSCMATRGSLVATFLVARIGALLFAATASHIPTETRQENPPSPIRETRAVVLPECKPRELRKPGIRSASTL